MTSERRRTVFAMRLDDDESALPALMALERDASWRWGAGFEMASPRVLIKPNWVATAPPPVTTSHALVGDVLDWVRTVATPSEIALGDMPTDRWNAGTRMMEQADAESVLRGLGVVEQFEGVGDPPVRIAFFDQEEWVTRPRPAGMEIWPDGIPIPRVAAESDLLIELIQLKTHWITGFSGSTKGLMGLLPLAGTRYIHAAPSAHGGPVEQPGLLVVPHTLRKRRDYCDRIAAIAHARCPDLFVVDARLAFAAEGPGRGPVVAPRWFAVTRDLVAADLFCVSVLRQVWEDDLPVIHDSQSPDAAGKPISEWYVEHADRIPKEHNGRIDDLVKFPLRRHPVIEADVEAGFWPRLHEPVELIAACDVDADVQAARRIADAMGAELTLAAPR